MAILCFLAIYPPNKQVIINVSGGLRLTVFAIKLFFINVFFVYYKNMTKVKTDKTIIIIYFSKFLCCLNKSISLISKSDLSIRFVKMYQPSKFL